MWREAGGMLPSHVSAEEIYHDLQKAVHDEFERLAIGDGYRIGSRWTGHSKLAFDICRNGDVQVRFRPNIDARIEEGETEARQAANEFHKQVVEYFQS
ncbi:MAG: hypothetical protein KKD94_03210 [Nanoarchaeota archaeon]|nr:hypothetical protein [Nanoarchaeota archaeon]